MAKKINVKLILELRDAGMGRNAIASTRRMSRNSVSDVFHIADAGGIAYGDVRNLDDQEVCITIQNDHESGHLRPPSR